jgi:hypothetical protein
MYSQTVTLTPGPDPVHLVAGVLLAAVLSGFVLRLARRPSRHRDPVRWFPTSMRSAGRALAQGRCEYPARFRPWRRCPHRARESDHFFPWAAGGATTLANLVAACSWHNQAKSGRWPSRLLAGVIARRRRAYFPAGRATRPGQRYRPQRPWTPQNGASPFMQNRPPRPAPTGRRLRRFADERSARRAEHRR